MSDPEDGCAVAAGEPAGAGGERAGGGVMDEDAPFGWWPPLPGERDEDGELVEGDAA